MNGFIFPKASSFPLLASLCLSFGFYTGLNYHGLNLELKSPLGFFSKKEIHFSKISWIQNTLENSTFSFASVDYPLPEVSKQEIQLAEFHFEKVQLKPLKANPEIRSLKALKKLEKAVQLLTRYDLFNDYRKVSEKLRSEFIIAIENPRFEQIQLAAAVSVTSNPIQKNVDDVTDKIRTSRINPKDEIKSLVQPITPKNIQIAADSTNNKMIDHVQTMNMDSIKTTRSSSRMNFSNQGTKKRYIKQELNIISDDLSETTLVQNIAQNPSIECSIAPKLHLKSPGFSNSRTSNQICPQQKTWISKDWNDEGWVKFEVEGYLPFVTYYPQINHPFTMLLDQNSMALLSLRSGIRSYPDYGIIFGILPEDAQVEFLGRAEEVQTIEMDGYRYFYFLNVEPGAGVLEIKYPAIKNETTLFTPVFKNTVTYLDLKKPIQMDIPIRIVKHGISKKENQAELEGLKVSLSTQTEIYAITDHQGKAILKSVFLTPGYPVFVDVSSKNIREKSYQYRFQLGKTNPKGEFILTQYQEKMIRYWVNQSNQKIYDQSGLVIGYVNRKKINGFKENHYGHVELFSPENLMKPGTYSVLWDQKISENDPLEGDKPRFFSMNIPEGLAKVSILNEQHQPLHSTLLPISPRVINVIHE